MPLRIFQVDAFTDRPFSGNPAAVCLLREPGEEAWMQQVAAEMNLSETAFVTEEGDAFGLRWFTPRVEVDLCGHATLASAHVLREEGRLPEGGVARFRTRSGVLSASLRGEWIELDFPAERVSERPAPDGLAEALRALPRFVGSNRMDCLVELDSEEAVRELRPDIDAIGRLDCRGVIVTARAAAAPPARTEPGRPEHDFVSRFFAPRVGVPEDPVTGSAHCGLGPFWAARLGKEEVVGYQASARGGYVRVRMKGERVVLSGKAVTVLRGELV